MPRPDDSPARAILSVENPDHQGRYLADTLARIGKPGFKTDVGDSPDIFRLDETGGPGAVLIVSNAAFPDFALEGAERAQQAAGHLPPDLARHVLVARTTGRHDGRSYALYPRIQPLAPNRLLQSAQLAVIGKPALHWLGGVAASTQRPVTGDDELETGFLAPCRYLAETAALPDRIRDRARRSLAAIGDGTFRPVCILQHGDFWRGNLLLGAGWPRAAEGLRFFAVIDWGSSSLSGYPYIDLLRFARSLKTGQRTMPQLVASYAAATGLPVGDLAHYACAHAGRLGLTRNEFPFDRYIAATRRLFEGLDRL